MTGGSDAVHGCINEGIAPCLRNTRCRNHSRHQYQHGGAGADPCGQRCRNRADRAPPGAADAHPRRRHSGGAQPRRPHLVLQLRPGRRRAQNADHLGLLASVGKVFIATLLAQAVQKGEVSLDDPVAKYVTELQQGGDIRKVTLGMLATHTSGLTRTPQQYEPSHRGPYKLPDFIGYLNSWQADEAHQPGKQDIYSNTGFALLALALQRRFDTPFAQLMETRLLAPLGMTSTALPVPRGNARGQLTPELRRRAVQGYNSDAQPVGEPGNEQGTFNWPGTGQIYSSARDMARFLTANLGAVGEHRELQEAMAFAQQGAFAVNPRFTQALAWQRVKNDGLEIVDKNGGLNNTSTYIGMMPKERLGIVILSNCGGEPATRIGRQIMLALARTSCLICCATALF